MLIEDHETCYRAVRSRDRRFDGVFYTAVASTGIYCRPSCPAITPLRRNVSFFRTAAAAQQAGFRACKRCRPDATPGSPEWDVDADTAGRAMRLIADGVVEREGVEGLAARVGYTSRHLSRLLVREVGAGPLALARARRVQTARTLIESTDMRLSDVAFAAGFASIRQFNDTVREVYATTPSGLRGAPASHRGDGLLELRLAVRRPYAADDVLGFLAARAVPGVEQVDGTSYSRTLRLPHGHGLVRLSFDAAATGGVVHCSLELSDLRDLASAVERCRRLVDGDCDPEAVDAHLAAHPVLAPLVRARPGLRVPGHVDGDELAVRAVLGQQVSLAGARRLAALLVERYGDPLPDGQGTLFPAASVLAGVPAETLPMPRARGRALTTLCAALARGEIVLDRGAERDAVRERLLALPGIGPWTADYIAMRALGDPDVLPARDVGIRNALARLGNDPAAGATGPVLSDEWRPWRSYAAMHLWRTLGSGTPDERKS